MSSAFIHVVTNAKILFFCMNKEYFIDYIPLFLYLFIH
jgi:hypothetical protein